MHAQLISLSFFFSIFSPASQARPEKMLYLSICKKHTDGGLYVPAEDYTRAYTGILRL